LLSPTAVVEAALGARNQRTIAAHMGRKTTMTIIFVDGSNLLGLLGISSVP
jgi:hypothetical protein